MVAFVIVSHSAKLSEGVADLARMSAPNARIFPAGGLPDGAYGTSFDLISEAVKCAYSEEGVILIFDMGSAAMTSEMVVESLSLNKVRVVDCPVAEGAVLGTVLAESGVDFDEIVYELENLSKTE